MPFSNLSLGLVETATSRGRNIFSKHGDIFVLTPTFPSLYAPSVIAHAVSNFDESFGFFTIHLFRF